MHLYNQSLICITLVYRSRTLWVLPYDDSFLLFIHCLVDDAKSVFAKHLRNFRGRTHLELLRNNFVIDPNMRVVACINQHYPNTDAYHEYTEYLYALLHKPSFQVTESWVDWVTPPIGVAPFLCLFCIGKEGHDIMLQSYQKENDCTNMHAAIPSIKTQYVLNRIHFWAICYESFLLADFESPFYRNITTGNWHCKCCYLVHVHNILVIQWHLVSSNIHWWYNSVNTR